MLFYILLIFQVLKDLIYTYRFKLIITMSMALKTISWFDRLNENNIEKAINGKKVKIVTKKIILGLYFYKNLKVELLIVFYNKVINEINY